MMADSGSLPVAQKSSKPKTNISSLHTFNEREVVRLMLTHIRDSLNGCLNTLDQWDQGLHLRDPAGANTQDKERKAG